VWNIWIVVILYLLYGITWCRSRGPARLLTALEEQYCHLTQVKVDKVPGLVRHIRTEVPAHDAVPRRVVFLIELLLDIRGDILLYIVLFDRLRRTVDGILLHVLAHVGVLDDGFAVGHLAAGVVRTGRVI